MAASAVRLLLDRGIQVRLDIVGSVFPGNETYQEELEQLIVELGISARVRLHGFQQSVWPYFADCDIVLVPSVGEESFGNTAVEASLAARPVIASNNAGLREATAASESAQLVPPGDPESISMAVDLVSRDWEHYCATALADADRVAEKFSHGNYGNALVDALELVTG